MESHDWVTVAREFGFPIAALLGLATSVSATLWWIGSYIVIPLRDRLIKWFDDHTEWMGALAKEQKSIRNDYERHHSWEEERANSTDDKLDILLQRKLEGGTAK